MSAWRSLSVVAVSIPERVLEALKPLKRVIGSLFKWFQSLKGF